MKKPVFIAGILLLALSACEKDLPQPPAPAMIQNPALAANYSTVKYWKLCTQEVKQGNTKYVCLPKTKPHHFCRSTTWKELHYLTPPMPACPETTMIN